MGTRFVGKKVIPRAFFAGAKYPVTTDTVDTFYPDPDVESTSVDGTVGMTDGGLGLSGWADIRDGAGETADDFSATADVAVNSALDTDMWATIYRAIALFDTSSIPDADPLTSANFGLYVTALVDQFSEGLELVASTPASNTELVAGDYAQLGATKFATTTSFSSLNTSAYNVIALNASGLAAITFTGVTKLGLRTSMDFNNAPSWSSEFVSDVTMSSADQAGTTQDPYLEVTHGAAATSAPILSLGVEPAILIWGR